MTRRARDEVVELLREPARRPTLTPARWDLLVRQARVAGLLPRVAWSLRLHGHLEVVPDPVRAHLDAAEQVALAQRIEVEREIAYVQGALRGLVSPIILLKGAAYLMADLPASRGRVFSDTDILVPKSRLAEVESALLIHGWATTHHSAYDQRYYREWMHELPPLVHLKRQTALDVHHAIAPSTGRIRPDASMLFERAVPLSAHPGLATLMPADMVLHSMLHLLVNDDLSHSLRDLSDLDLLLRHFGVSNGFWSDLLSRASELGLARILGDCSRYAVKTLGTPIPREIVEGGNGRRSAVSEAAIDWLWGKALRSPHSSTADTWTVVAQGALYVRAHWLRMPPGLLVRHLTVKALGLNR